LKSENYGLLKCFSGTRKCTDFGLMFSRFFRA